CRSRLPHLQLAPVDGHRQNLHRDCLPGYARSHHRPLLSLPHRPLCPPVWADRVSPRLPAGYVDAELLVRVRTTSVLSYLARCARLSPGKRITPPTGTTCL